MHQHCLLWFFFNCRMASHLSLGFLSLFLFQLLLLLGSYFCCWLKVLLLCLLFLLILLVLTFFLWNGQCTVLLCMTGNVSVKMGTLDQLYLSLGHLRWPVNPVVPFCFLVCLSSTGMWVHWIAIYLSHTVLDEEWPTWHFRSSKINHTCFIIRKPAAFK